MSTRRCPHCANAATAKKVLIDSFVGPYEMWHVTCNSVFCNKKSDLFKTKEAAEADWDAKFPIKDLYNKESYRFQLKDSEKQWLENRKDVCFSAEGIKRPSVFIVSAIMHNALVKIIL